MKKEDFSFLSNDGRTTIHALKWIPDSGEIRAVIQISHGMIEYIERYTAFAEFLTSNGFIVYGHDHLGHGHSVKTKKDYGYFCEDKPSDVLVNDMHHLRCIAQQENPDMPYFMLAHSMGSYLLRKYITKYAKGLSGVILFGTGYVPAVTTRNGLRLARVVARIRGSHYSNIHITKLTYGKSYKKFDMTGKDPTKNWTTRDVEMAKKNNSDPMCAFLFSMNGYIGLMETVAYVCRQENVKKVPSELPIFFISGDDDPVGDLGEGVRRVYDMFRRSGKKDLSFKLYEGMRHEVLNEIGKEEVYEDVLKWLNARITKTLL